MTPIDRRTLVLLAAIVVAQTLLFYEHTAISLTVLFSLGIGVWLRHWRAALWALGAFIPAYAIALLTGWMRGARPVADLLIGAGLAFLAGLIGGGIFQVLREDRGERLVETEAPAARRAELPPFQV